MKKFLAAVAFVIGVAGLTAGYVGPSAIAQTTIHFGALINALVSASLPVTATDFIPIFRTGGSTDGNKIPANTFLQTANNLSEVTTTNKATSRTNLGMGNSVSIMDYGADATGVASSDTAFVSCTTQSGKDCHIPKGIYLISCTTHNAVLTDRTAPITIWGDGYNQSTLRVAPSCVLPTTGLINLANMRDIAIDVNSATATAATTIVSSNTTALAVRTPEFDHVYLYNVGNNTAGVGARFITGINVGSLSGANVEQLRITNNAVRVILSSTTANQCIKVTQAAGTVIGGWIDGNTCIGNAIDVNASRISITNNDISAWSYRAGIYTEQGTNSNTYMIANNRLSSASTVVTAGVPTDGVANFGTGSVIANNFCQNIGGVCVANSGQVSTIKGNYSIGAGNRADASAGPSYFSGYQDSTFNGNNSHWDGNYATKSVITGYTNTTTGFSAPVANTDGLSLTNNYFPLLKPYTFF